MTAFDIIKKACALKILESGLTDGEALYRAILDYNPYLAAKVMNSPHDPRTNINNCILFLVAKFSNNSGFTMET
jgi:hypothetical protein